jgi:hypothetical protein
MENTLSYIDDLNILSYYTKDELIALVYPDPPFNSNATYNVLFVELHEGKKIDIPPIGHSDITFKKAERHIKKENNRLL